ncbi:MAG: uroporphyrinogen decarboxylase family protein [Acetivibrionales bacterium]|jgi:uroporphyrinogen decarboxylase
MTGRERVLRVLNLGEPDRVPTFEWVIHPSIIKALTGQESEIEFIKQMDIDGISVGLSGKKEIIDSRHFIDEWGITRVSYDEYPNPIGNPIKNEKDLKKFKAPDPDADHLYSKIMTAMKEVGKEKAVIGRVRDVFSQPRDLMGFEDFLMAFYLQPELVAALMEICVDYSTRVAKNMKELGVEVIVIGDDIATNAGLLMNPEMFREQVMPYFTKLVHNFKDMGLYVIKHSDGDLRVIMDDLVQSGVDCIDPIDPLGNMDMKEMKKKYGGRVALKGNIDCVETLVNKTDEEVVNEVKQCILDGGLNGGLVISSSNSIHSGINPHNYKVFLDAAKEYGVYPLDIEKLNERV